MKKMEYPPTRRVDETETLAGVSFPDPYRWLEKPTDEVRGWQCAQGELAADYVRRWPHFETLKRAVARLTTDRRSLPISAAGRWFRVLSPKGASHSQVIVAESPGGEGRVLFDPAVENPQAPPFLSWLSSSPDGRTLALGLCADGSESNAIRLIDVETGTRLPNAPSQLLMDAWLGGVQWLANSSGFYFTALTGSAHAFQQAICFHRLSDLAPQNPLSVPIPADSKDYRVVIPSRCGRWATAVHRMLTPTPVALRDLSDAQGQRRPFVTDVAGTVAGHILGDQYIAVTDVQAPRGRVVAIALDSTTPNDPASWREIIPESAAVIRGITPVGERLYVNELVDTYSRVRIFDYSGAAIGEVPLPQKGAVAELPFPMMNLLARGHGNEFAFAFSSFTQSPGIYLHRPGKDRLETLIQPDVTIENAVVEDKWATSADGTRVPYHTVRLARVDVSRPQPALIYAYGGFNVPLSPQFPGPFATFIAAGGVFVHGHLRGGGEFGLDWWRGGSLKNKQNGYFDLYAIAENLTSDGTSTPQLLGVTGASNGGMMSSVALTQRPDLWRVAVPRVPFIDVIGACRDPYGLMAVKKDVGDPEDPDDVRRMAGFSPYYGVKPGTSYPAVFIDAGDTDPRCPPWHARKFAARLQAAQAGEAPILLHIWDNVGHGWATAKDTQIEEHTEWLAFVMLQLGLTPEASS